MRYDLMQKLPAWIVTSTNIVTHRREGQGIFGTKLRALAAASAEGANLAGSSLSEPGRVQIAARINAIHEEAYDLLHLEDDQEGAQILFQRALDLYNHGLRAGRQIRVNKVYIE
jgi:hypothetical protein